MNKQIQEETFSAYLYYSMAGFAEAANLGGFAMWLKVQALEELTHAHRFYHHIIVDRRGEIELLQIDKPQTKWKDMLDVFQAAYKHEVHITERINLLVSIAREEKDYTAETGLLQWFINEQIEEEFQTDEIVQKLKMLGDDKLALYQLDKELGMRVFTQDPTFVL